MPKDEWKSNRYKHRVKRTYDYNKKKKSTAQTKFRCLSSSQKHKLYLWAVAQYRGKKVHAPKIELWLKFHDISLNYLWRLLKTYYL